MQVSFRAESASLQLASNTGMSLNVVLRLKPGSHAFALESGVHLSEAVVHLTVHPDSQSPYADKRDADGRLGELRPFMALPSKERNIYLMWLHIPADQFNALVFEISRRNWPTDITFGVDEGDEGDAADGLMAGVYNDISSVVLALRYFVFTLQMPLPG